MIDGIMYGISVFIGIVAGIGVTLGVDCFRAKKQNANDKKNLSFEIRQRKEKVYDTS